MKIIYVACVKILVGCHDLEIPCVATCSEFDILQEVISHPKLFQVLKKQ